MLPEQTNDQFIAAIGNADLNGLRLLLLQQGFEATLKCTAPADEDGWVATTFGTPLDVAIFLNKEDVAIWLVYNGASQSSVAELEMRGPLNVSVEVPAVEAALAKRMPRLAALLMRGPKPHNWSAPSVRLVDGNCTERLDTLLDSVLAAPQALQVLADAHFFRGTVHGTLVTITRAAKEYEVYFGDQLAVEYRCESLEGCLRWADAHIADLLLASA